MFLSFPSFPRLLSCFLRLGFPSFATVPSFPKKFASFPSFLSFPNLPRNGLQPRDEWAVAEWAG